MGTRTQDSIPLVWIFKQQNNYKKMLYYYYFRVKMLYYYFFPSPPTPSINRPPNTVSENETMT